MYSVNARHPCSLYDLKITTFIVGFVGGHAERRQETVLHTMNCGKAFHRNVCSTHTYLLSTVISPEMGSSMKQYKCNTSTCLLGNTKSSQQCRPTASMSHKQATYSPMVSMKGRKLSADSHSSVAQTQYTEHIDRPNRHFLAIRYFATIHCGAITERYTQNTNLIVALIGK